MNFKQYQDLAELSDFKWARVYDGHRNLIGSVSENSYKDFIDKLKRMSAFFPGVCRIESKTDKNHQKESVCTYDVQFSDAPQPVLAGYTNTPPVDMAAMKKELLAELRKEQQEKDKIQKLVDETNDLKKQLRESRSLQGKLGAVADILAEKFLPGGGAKPVANLAGTTETEKKEYTITDQDKKNLLEANTLFLTHTTSRMVLEIAKAVDRKPELIELVKSFLKIPDEQA